MDSLLYYSSSNLLYLCVPDDRAHFMVENSVAAGAEVNLVIVLYSSERNQIP